MGEREKGRAEGRGGRMGGSWKGDVGRVSVRFVRKSPFISSVCRSTERDPHDWVNSGFRLGYTSNKEHQNDSPNNMSLNPRFFT